MRRLALTAVAFKDVAFSRCDLTQCEITNTSLKGLDLRSCSLSGMAVVPECLRGAVVTPLQAVELAGLLGLVIRPEDA